MSSEVEFCALNDGGEFSKTFLQMYSTKLELKEGHNESHTTFLELEISIEKGKFIYKMFDKRGVFHIDRMPSDILPVPGRWMICA